MRSGGASANDPFIVVDPVGLGPAYRNLTSKIFTTPRITAGESTGVFVIAGQSNAVNVVPTPYTPTNSTKVDQFFIENGGTYRAVDPLLGVDGQINGNMFTRLADKLVTAGIFARVILVPVALGSTTVQMWASGGICNSRLIVAKKRLAAVGLTPTAWLWQQGEGDHGTTQANYTSRLASVIATPRAIGDVAPWFIAKGSYASGTVDTNIQAAMVAAVNGVDIFAGPDTDTLTGTAVNRNPSDDIHWSTAGADAASTLWKTALHAVF